MTCHKVTNDEFIMAASTIFAVASTRVGKEKTTSARAKEAARHSVPMPIARSRCHTLKAHVSRSLLRRSIDTQIHRHADGHTHTHTDTRIHSHVAEPNERLVSVPIECYGVASSARPHLPDEHSSS